MKYSEEFKRDAVALVRAGATQREVCRDLGSLNRRCRSG
ncbi:transposase [Leucobacter sp. M11]